MIDQWVDVTAKSAQGVAGDMGFEHCEVVGNGPDFPDGLAGAFVPLVGQSASVQLGVMSSPEGQEAMGRAILQMEPDESIEREDITDAVGEFANCLVGRIKREMRKVDSTLKIGLPVFIEGRVEDIGHAEHKTVRLLLNGFDVSLVVVVGG